MLTLLQLMKQQIDALVAKTITYKHFSLGEPKSCRVTVPYKPEAVLFILPSPVPLPLSVANLTLTSQHSLLEGTSGER